MIKKSALASLLAFGILNTYTLPVLSNGNLTTFSPYDRTKVKALLSLDNDEEINLTIKEAIVGDVLEGLATQAGLQLIIDTDKESEEIKRINFEGIKLSEAFSYIISYKNLAVRRIDDTLFISDPEKLKASGVKDAAIKSFKLANIKPTEAISQFESYYKAADIIPPNMVANDVTNTLSIIARPIDIDFFEKIFPIIDTPIPQVMVEIKLIELNEQASKFLGTSYGFGQDKVGASFNNAAGAVQQRTAGTDASQFPLQPGVLPNTSQGASISFNALRNFTANFNAKIDATIADSNAKILSNPKIAIQNGKSAIFSSTESVPIVKTTQTAAGQTQNVEQLAIGETINITPDLIDPTSGYVTLTLNPQIGTRGKDVIVNGNPVPEQLQRSLTTTMKIKSGESIVIGGLKRRNNTTASSKIPLLGDIPFLGALFGTNSVSGNETELIIMVTPYILKEETKKSSK